MKRKWLLLILLFALGIDCTGLAEEDASVLHGLPFGSTFAQCDLWARGALGDALAEPTEVDGWQVSKLPGKREDSFGVPMTYRFVFEEGKLRQFVAEQTEAASGVQALRHYQRILAAVKRRAGAPKATGVLCRDGVWFVQYFEDCMVALVYGEASGVYVFVQPGLTAGIGGGRPRMGIE